VHLLLAAAVGATALSVPFVAQRKDTCGAAALTMVLRYWGRPVLHDQVAGELVEPELHGALGSRLAERARSEGLRAATFTGDLPGLREHVARGRPVLVAWREGGGRFHNVVVVGFDAAGVLVNDPARGARRRIPLGRFQRLWAAAGHWSLVVAPEPR
jgi:ABC-type bacteriocin/lantibiotic exporter with double-glycine peptidase domain